MRKYQKAAVVAAMLGSVSFLGAGVVNASDGDEKVKITNDQTQACEQNDSAQGLINLDDVNVSVAILGLSNQDNSERESVTCSQNFTLGK
ncbi:MULTISPECIES: hypothetical protein [Streptomyces]|uniref:Uncharacterized protein n=1 Tax=Streptomyces cadmiisoli TaxID=2184053 RepID=A0A2Z4J445_9ACTN|nr:MULTISPECIES: hypothetical protein [Streptomyces]AWW39518.1 hypothetical protein DN051_25020 [Streptomyces cadmiisoli]KOV51883.1 hypothetical protein ADL00_39585 [Streptomyces sp. AS58]